MSSENASEWKVELLFVWLRFRNSKTALLKNNSTTYSLGHFFYLANCTTKTLGAAPDNQKDTANW